MEIFLEFLLCMWWDLDSHGHEKTTRKKYVHVAFFIVW